jgi:hypothetical protein
MARAAPRACATWRSDTSENMSGSMPNTTLMPTVATFSTTSRTRPESTPERGPRATAVASRPNVPMSASVL